MQNVSFTIGSVKRVSYDNPDKSLQHQLTLFAITVPQKRQEFYCRVDRKFSWVSRHVTNISKRFFCCSKISD